MTHKLQVQRYVRMCEHAFKDDSETAIAALGYNDVVFICDERTTTELYVAENEQEIVVVFQATKTYDDWVSTNFKACKAEGVLGMQHQGFLDAYISVIDMLHPLLDELLHEKDRVLRFIGHSLGGALAITGSTFYPVAEVHAFGNPRVFSRRAAERYEQEVGAWVHRYVYAGDFITRVPALVMDYKHVGDVHYFTQNGYVFNPKPLRVYRDMVTDMINELLAWEFYKFEDHAIKLYKNSIDWLFPSKG